MSDGNDSTETLIESLHASRKKRSLVINPDYLDDEKLPEQDRTRVLREIFNRNTFCGGLSLYSRSERCAIKSPSVAKNRKVFKGVLLSSDDGSQSEGEHDFQNHLRRSLPGHSSGALRTA